VDTNVDNKCDVCDKDMEAKHEHTDTDKDGICDDCKAMF